MMYMEKNLNLDIKSLLPNMQIAILKENKYFGIPTYKNPLDAWIYQEIIYEQKPDYIIELGNKYGGSLLMMAHWLDAIGHGNLIGVDRKQKHIDEKVRNHPRILLIEGDVLECYYNVVSCINGNHYHRPKKVMVIEDSAHTYEVTIGCLRKYSELVHVGGYYIVEDSIINQGLDRPRLIDRGPYEAIRDFLLENKCFVPDRRREKFLITWNPSGYLKRIC